jgi:hypothetical protein
VSVGLHRQFVIGTRRADQAGDGNLYSRALQANTTHYYSLTCPGGSTVTGQFTTANPPLGNSYPEPLPFNSAAWGNYGWPTINWNDQTQVYIDPLTGIAIKRFSSPGHHYGFTRGVGYDQAGQFSFYNDPNNAWTNAAQVIGASQATTAIYSGANSDPIFVAWGQTGMPDGFAGWAPIDGGGGVRVLDNLQVALFGWGTDPSAANRTVEFCLSFYDSGATCNTPYYTAVLRTSAPSSSSATSAVYPSSTTFPDGGTWAGWAPCPDQRYQRLHRHLFSDGEYGD